MTVPIKLTWQEKCRQIADYHRRSLADNPKHRVEDTAKDLGRSSGRISEELMLANWMKKDPKVEKFKQVQDAIEYVKEQKKLEKLS